MQKTNDIQRWIVVLVAALVFFYNFVQLNMFSTLSKELMTAFELNATQFGSLSSKYFYGDIIFLLPAGLILDRFSTRKVLLSAMLLCIISFFGFAWSHSLPILGIMRFISGVAAAFAFLGSIRLAACWFPSKQLALATGSVVTLAMLGGMVAHTPMMLLMHAVGWRAAMLVFGFLGIVIITAMWFIVQDWPKDCSAEDACLIRKTAVEKIGLWDGFRMVVFNRYNWFGGLYTSLMNLPVFLLGALWGTMYLMQTHHLSETQASLVNGMIFLGNIIGCPLVGWISDSLERRILPMVAGAVLSLLIILLIVYVPTLSFLSLFVLFFLLGLISSTQTLSYPTVTELNSPLVASSAISIVSLLVVLGGALAQPFFGWLMDLHWNTQIVNGTPIYSAQDFKLAMLMLPAVFLASIIIAFLIKETRCEAQVTP